MLISAIHILMLNVALKYVCFDIVTKSVCIGFSEMNSTYNENCIITEEMTSAVLRDVRPFLNYRNFHRFAIH